MTRIRLLILLIVLVLTSLLVAGCKDDPVTIAPPTAAADALPDFSDLDVNPTSATSGSLVSPRDYLGQVSAWYFGHAT
jgi:hypothetical protein